VVGRPLKAGIRLGERGKMKRLERLIKEYSERNGYPAEHFASSKCGNCNGSEFEILVNTTEGVAARICTKCNSEHGIGDSDDFIDEVDEVFPVECGCGSRAFNIVCGVSLYSDSEDVRWFYLACRCTSCDDAGVYADWKNEFIGYRGLLDNV
jgi:hypothetical protein